MPNLKIFVTASAEVRAQRRYDELKAKGMEADFADIHKNIQERDYIDSHRETSPLRKADDASNSTTVSSLSKAVGFTTSSEGCRSIKS